MRVAGVLAVLCAISIFGCSTTVPRGQAVSKAAPKPAAVLWEAPITFQSKGPVLPVPLVELSIGGVATRFIVDTGASHHVLTKELAARANVQSHASSEGSGQDHAGASFAVAEAEGTVRARISANEIELREVSVIPGPPPFESLGLGGLLSPQHLHPTAHVAIDLAGQKLVLVEGSPDEIAAWAHARWGGLALVSLPRSHADRKIMITAAVQPFADTICEIDTGGSGTEFLASYLSDAAPSAEGSNGVGMSGAEVKGFPVHDRVLRVAGRTTPVKEILARPTMGKQPFTGLIGMDVLRGSVVIVSPKQSDPVLWLMRQ